jgi:hypothetical protein
MGERMSRTKVTRSAQPGPQFPSRHLKPVPVKPPPPVPPPGHVEPVRTKNAKAHYGWGDGKVAAFWTVHYASIIALALTAIAAVWWLYQRYHLAETELAYAQIGYEVCREPLLTVPEYTCEAGALDCFTKPQAAVLERMKIQAAAVNKWRAERCLPLM